MKACLFCGSANGETSVEHVLPKWARDAFDIRGSLTLYASEGSGEPARRRVAGLGHLNITLREAICRKCNSGFLSQLETAVRPFLAPMMVTAQRRVLDVAEQKALATWAVKTALLLELSFRQNYRFARPLTGYMGSASEFAWLWRQQSPPPRSLVWIGCWDCARSAPLTYEPSGAPRSQLLMATRSMGT